jgi:hypothetical protein
LTEFAIITSFTAPQRGITIIITIIISYIRACLNGFFQFFQKSLAPKEKYRRQSLRYFSYMVKRALRYLTCLRSMAAAAKHNERNNNDPAAVVAITKQIAETVVIHT